MSALLRVTITGTRQVQASLREVADEIKDWKPFWTRMSLFLRQKVFLAFSTEGVESGSGKWAPLSPKYALWKFKNAPGSPLLVLSQRMFLSLGGGRHPDHVERHRRSEFWFGSRVPYLPFHVTGTTWMPARPPLVLMAEDQRFIIEEARKFIGEIITSVFMRRGRRVSQARSLITGRFV